MISGEAKRNKEITCPLSNAAACEPIHTHTCLHLQGREELVLMAPGPSPVLVKAWRGCQQTSQLCRRGQDAPDRAVHAVSPVPRGLSLLKGVIGNAAEMLCRAPVNI